MSLLASLTGRHWQYSAADPVAFRESLVDTSISIVLDEHVAILSANQLQVGIADKNTMSACVASVKEHHDSRGAWT